MFQRPLHPRNNTVSPSRVLSLTKGAHRQAACVSGGGMASRNKQMRGVMTLKVSVSIDSVLPKLKTVEVGFLQFTLHSNRTSRQGTDVGLPIPIDGVVDSIAVNRGGDGETWDRRPGRIE